MERKPDRNLLVRARVFSQWDNGLARFKIQIIQRIFQLVEPLSYSGMVDIWFTRTVHFHPMIIVGAIKTVWWQVLHAEHPLADKLLGFITTEKLKMVISFQQ